MIQFYIYLQTSIENLKIFFEDKFGHISAIRIRQKKCKNQRLQNLRSSRAYAFVTFTDTLAAYK